MPPNPRDYREFLIVEFWISPWTQVPDVEGEQREQRRIIEGGLELVRV